MTIFIIARLTFREAARRKILLAALLLGLVYLLIYGVGFYYVNQEANRSEFGPGLLELNQIRNFLFMAGLYVVNFLTVMMAVLTSVDTVSGEIASRILDLAGIVCNKNTLPGDRSAADAHGIRLGTPWATQRGMGKTEMETVGSYRVFE